MNVVGTSYFDTWANYQVGYDIISTSTSGGYHVIRVYGVLNVTGNNISWSWGNARVWDNTVGIGTWYGNGSYTLVSKDVTVYSDANGNFGATYIDGAISTSYKSGSCGGNAYLPHIDRQSTINSFSGTAINKNFSATYTAHTNYENRLRISIPSVKALQTFNNYSSGSSVRLSSSAQQQIRQYTSAKTIQLGGVIETWNGGTKIGESSEIKINVKIPKGLRVKVNNTWKEAIPYVRVNGTWKEARPHVKVSNQWKEGI